MYFSRMGTAIIFSKSVTRFGSYFERFAEQSVQNNSVYCSSWKNQKRLAFPLETNASKGVGRSLKQGENIIWSC